MYSRQVTTRYWCEWLPRILTTSGIPKIEAINWWHVSKSCAYISSGKIPYMRTSCYHRLLKWVITMHLRLGTDIRGYHIVIPQVVYQETEATNWRLFFKTFCTYKVRKKLFMVNKVNTCYWGGYHISSIRKGKYRSCYYYDSCCSL